MRKFRFNKPLVVSPYPPTSKNVLWVKVDTQTQAAIEIKEVKASGQWETVSQVNETMKEELVQAYINLGGTKDLSEASMQEVIKAFSELQPVGPDKDLFSYGVRWTKSGILESPKLERVGNPALHRTLPIQNLFRGCVAQQEEIQYYLDPEDWSKKEDGTPSKLDGTDGTVRIHTPKFYLRSWAYKDKETGEDVREVRISQVQIDESWKEIPSCVIDAYCPTLDITEGASIYDGKAVSVCSMDSANPTNFIGGCYNNWCSDHEDGEIQSQYIYTNADARLTDYGKPLTGLTRAEARQFAQNAGAELLSYFIYKALYWCMVIEYGTFDLMMPIDETLTPEGFKQGGIGRGLRNGNSTITEEDEYGENNGSGIVNRTDYTNGYGRYGARTPNGWANELGNGTGEKVLFAAGQTVGTGINPLIQDVSVFKWRGFENFCGDQYIWLDGFLSGAYYDEDNDVCYPSAIYMTEMSENLDDNYANKEIVLPQIKADGNGVVIDINLGTAADMFASEEDMDGEYSYHVGMCDTQYKGNSPWYNGDDNQVVCDNYPTVLYCGAYCCGSGPGIGPGYLVADNGLSDAYDVVGFRTLNRNPYLAH